MGGLQDEPPQVCNAFGGTPKAAGEDARAPRKKRVGVTS
jgi:hypothetical protein